MLTKLKVPVAGAELVSVIRLRAAPVTFQLLFTVMVFPLFTLNVCARVPVSLKLLQFRLPAMTFEPPPPLLNAIVLYKIESPPVFMVTTPESVLVNKMEEVPITRVRFVIVVKFQAAPPDPESVQVPDPMLTVRTLLLLLEKKPAFTSKLFALNVPVVTVNVVLTVPDISRLFWSEKVPLPYILTD